MGIKPARGVLLVEVDILGEKWPVYLATEKQVPDLVDHEGRAMLFEGRIYLNADIAPARRPYVLVHEIGHVIALHTGATHALREKFGSSIADDLEEDWMMHVLPAFCATLKGMGWLRTKDLLSRKEKVAK